MPAVARVAAIGGGGVRVPLLLHGLLRRSETLGLQEIALYDLHPERAELMAAVGAAMAHDFASGTRIHVARTLDEAVEGTTFVFSAVRIGGAEGRILDERIALRHGLLGQETTGIGGMSMALRTIPFALHLAERMQVLAPDAWFLNFTNPSGLIVEALAQAGVQRVIGLCDAPSGLKGDICRFLGIEEEEASIGYQGLNHLGWVQSLHIRGEERLPALLADAERLAAGVRSLGFFGPDLLRGLGLLPNEYLFYYYFRDAALGRELQNERTRGEMVQTWNESLYQGVAAALAQGDGQEALSRYRDVLAARRNSYMAEVTKTQHDRGITTDSIFREEGYEGLALRTMTALSGGGEAELVLNVPSAGRSDVLAAQEVGELTCRVDARGATPLPRPPLPPGPRSLVRSVKDYELLTVRAAVHGDREAALQAAMAHPLIGDRGRAAACLDDLLSAHRLHLPRFPE